jgi:hypothetical protein
MLLNEIFDDQPEGGSVVQELRDAILDMLMPLVANGVPHTSVQAVIDKMREEQTGVEIDRALVMHVLDPKEIGIVTKIEGDKIHFKLGDGDDRAASEEQEEKDEKKLKSTALNQAKKDIKKPAAPKPDLGGPL